MKIKLLLLSLLANVSSLIAQTPDQVEKYVSSETKSKLIELSKAFEVKYKESLERALIDYPTEITIGENKKAYLRGLRFDGSPIYISSDNAGAAQTVNADKLYPGGDLGLSLTGAGLELGMWEIEPARPTHINISGRISQGDGSIFGGATEESDHATHVAGTMIGSGLLFEDAKGMAYEASVLGFTAYQDYAEMASEAANGMLLSNHSYGWTGFGNGTTLLIDVFWYGKYESQAQDVDELTFDAPYYLPIFSAGNDRQLAGNATNKGGYDMLLGDKVSKNAMTVAAVYEVTDYNGPGSVDMSLFSNWGPTDDGRIKPDISAKGVDVFSSIATSDVAYASYDGTSMASPGVTGTLGLLQQHFYNEKDNYMKAATVKGLVAHTASEAGSNAGPDYKFGWGLLNAESAAECISNDGLNSIISEKSLSNGTSFSMNVTALGGEPLVVTISWTDPAGEVYVSSASDMLDYDEPVLINDLDVRVTKNTNTFYPWKLNPALPQAAASKDDNNVDNIEKIQISNPSGEYTITVTHKGELVNELQEYSIIVTGIDATLGVDDNQAQNVAVWPNPAKEIINLKLTSVENNSNVSLYDIHGRMVYQSELKSSSLLHTINVKELASGVYFLNVENGAQTFNKKIVIE